MSRLKILVATKRVIDHNVRIRVLPDGGGVETAGVRMSMNPFCKHAVEAAVQLRETGHDAEIVAVSVGPAGSKDVLLTAMAMGADRGILIETESRVEPLGVAKIFMKLVAEEQANLVIMGKQSVDGDHNQTGQMLAGLLGWPQATFASSMKLVGETLTIEREVDFGRVEITASLPAVVTADLRLNTPRNTALPLVMKARQKPLEVRDADSLGVDLAPRLTVHSTKAPPERVQGKQVLPDELAGEIQSILNEMEAG